MKNVTEKRNISDIYPLSPMQQGMLFHNLVAPDSGVYVEILSCTLKGELNIAAFRSAWQRVIDRHAILRTAFLSGDLKEPVQVVYRQITLDIRQEDWMPDPPDLQQERLAGYLETERIRGFTLNTPPLMRLALIRLAQDTWQFVWVYHHILMDGWSNAILFQEVMAFYNAFAAGREIYPELPRGYRDYIVWLKRQDMAAAEAYWRNQLDGFFSPTPIVAPNPAPPAKGADGQPGEPEIAEREFWLTAEKSRQIQALAKKLNLTLNSLVCAAWALLLSRYCGEEDICFGVTVSGRPPNLPGSENMVGLFINTLPLRVRIDPRLPVQTWLKDFQAQLVEMRQYEYSPLVEIQGWSQVPRHLHLFENILVYENFPTRAMLNGQDARAGLEIDEIESVEQTNYPLTAIAGATVPAGAGAIAVTGASGEIMLRLLFDIRLYSGDWIERMLGHWANLLEAFVTQPSQALAKICLLNEKERRQILVDWNQTAADFPADSCAHELFETQAARRPQAIAVDFDSQQVSYAALNRRANQLAHFLIHLGVNAETRVGLCFERSVEMIIAILGVLKAGGAYLPLDPAYPPDRLSFMITDSGIQYLITSRSLGHNLPAGDHQVVTLDGEEAAIASQPGHNPGHLAGFQRDDAPNALANRPDRLAYIIYTSGSTGRPKGVLLEHRGLTNLVTHYARTIGLGPGSRMLQFFSYSFDGSIADIFSALTSGATLCSGQPENLMPGPALDGFLREHQVTHGMVTPSALSVLPAEDLPYLQVLLTGGELCTRDILEPWVRNAPGRRLINAYGPTEGTVISTLYEIDNLRAEGQNIPIGRPLPNTSLYILDPHLNPVPVGVAGEVYTGGIGLARGYLNRPELTAEKFISNPFEENTPGLPSSPRLYRTGDLGRFRPDGAVEFLGRVDDQVKVRGFRIELGEIEAALRLHEQVKAAAVAVVNGALRAENARLVAYIVPRGEASLSLSQVQAYLRKSLPEYMLPGALVLLDALPLTPSGKINRKALAGIPLAGSERTGLGSTPGSMLSGTPGNMPEHIAPRDEIEAKLCQIWEDVLNLRPIGVTDSFFDLGGHSLLAVRVMALIKEKLGQDVSLLTLFQSPTIEQLADALRRGSEIVSATNLVAAIDRMAMDQLEAQRKALSTPLEAGPLQAESEPEANGKEKILVPLQARSRRNQANLPLYFIHPSGGSTHWYLDLAAALGKDQPFYAFQARGIDGDLPIHTTIEDMANCYLRALRQFQPHGPYQLGSWSLGVIIAYEMAQRLAAQGEEVALLAMLDQGPTLPHPKPVDDADYLFQTFGKEIPIDIETLRMLSWDDQVAYVLKVGKQRRFIFPEIKLAEFRHFIHLMRTQVEAWRNYTPQPYPGRITIYHAAGQEHPAHLGSDLGWASLAQGGVEICQVPGDHLSMIHKPHVRQLAQALRCRLNATSNRPADAEAAASASAGPDTVRR